MYSTYRELKYCFPHILAANKKYTWNIKHTSINRSKNVANINSVNIKSPKSKDVCRVNRVCSSCCMYIFDWAYFVVFPEDFWKVYIYKSTQTARQTVANKVSVKVLALTQSAFVECLWPTVDLQLLRWAFTHLVKFLLVCLFFAFHTNRPQNDEQQNKMVHCRVQLLIRCAFSIFIQSM